MQTHADLSYAGIWKRLFASGLDLLFFMSLFFPLTRIIKGVWLMSAGDHRWAHGLFITDPLCIGFLIFMALYFIILEGFWGATLGKWLLGLRVIQRESGQRPGLKRSLIRNLLRAVDSLPAFNILGIVLIIRSPENARFGDRIADTRVISLPAPKNT
jgi:uncharacterized RDD family membrane protein YckC